MPKEQKSEQLFHEYFHNWVKLYKVDAIRNVTLKKYLTTNKWLVQYVPKLKLCDLTRQTYQQILNDYAAEHEKQTTMNFHHQLKSAILDAVDDGLILNNPVRKVVIKGKVSKNERAKFLNQTELKSLLNQLQLGDELNWDWFILIAAKTGLRFSEILALIPEDFDFENHLITVNKSWDYKDKEGGFQPTKNTSSNRKIQIDIELSKQLKKLLATCKPEKAIFIKDDSRVFNSTINDYLKRLCEQAEVPIITMHSLRHTHASLLIFAGVSIASVSRRLGHATITTTQETYLHIIKELEIIDGDKITKLLMNLI